MKDLYVAVGVDCDPDRATYPRHLSWRGVEHLPRLLEIDDVVWTLNVRADTQIRDRCGSAAFCHDRYRHIWDAAARHGSAIGWHLHYYDRQGRQDTSERNILENIRVGSDALGTPDLVHMGWTFQNDFSVRHLYEAGVRIDASPTPRMRFGGRGGTDAYDWTSFAYRPVLWHGVRMIPAYTFRHNALERRFGTERVMLTATTHPSLYRSLIRDFLRTGQDFFLTYFHADELVPAVGGWRDHLYGFRNLQRNVKLLREAAEREGYTVRFVTVRELAHVLFADRGQRAAEREPPRVTGDARCPLRSISGRPAAQPRAVLVTRDSVFGRYLAASLYHSGTLDRVIVETGRPSWRFFWRKLRRIGPFNAAFQLAFDRWFRRVGARELPPLSLPPHDRVSSINRCAFGEHDLVIAFGTSIVSTATLARVRQGILNLHTGWLPDYRGVKSEYWALAHGDHAKVGWTLHYMTPRLDDGPIVLRRAIPAAATNAAQLRARLLSDAVPALARFIDDARAHGVESIARAPQEGGAYFSAPTWREWLGHRRTMVTKRDPALP